MLTVNNKATFIQDLITDGVFPHQVDGVQLIETHISWVLLTGEFAYKIKKPVTFDFVDYSTLKKRKHFCELEVELNRRFAGELYLDVVPVVERDGKPHVLAGEHELKDGESPTQFAVKMNQFPQDAIVAARLQSPDLTASAIDDFGRYLAQLHPTLESALPVMDCVQPDRVIGSAMDNFDVLHSSLFDDTRQPLLQRLEKWTANQSGALADRFRERLLEGFVRRCHGDMHLKNVIQLNGELVAFDGIEFNEELQWIDVLSELAFPVMDFVARGRKDLAWRLLNAYLEETGDYAGLDVLRYYLVYRALVRAKVTCLNPNNWKSGEGATPETFDGPWDKYLKTATYFAFEMEPRISITHGFSGSGKSTVAMEILEQEGGVRIRADVERHRLAAKFNRSDKYSVMMSDWVYKYLNKMAVAAIHAGFPVVVDATFLLARRRQPFEDIAREYDLDFEIIDCSASIEELSERIRNRGPDPSEATVEVLKMQMASHDPLTADELASVRKSTSVQ